MINIVKYKTDNGMVELNADIVKKYLVSGKGRVTEQEVMMFLKLCESQKLNPWVRDAYLIKYGDNAPATMVTGKDVFIKRAMKHPAMDGIKSGVVVLIGNKMTYREGNIVLKTDNLVGGWCEVYRKDMKYPLRCECSYSEFAQHGQNGRKTSWDKMPGLMIAKVATSQALRLAFPEDFCGLYDSAEMKTELPDKEEPVVVEYTNVENEKSKEELPTNQSPKYITKDNIEDLFTMADRNKDVILAAIGYFGYKSSKEILADDYEWIFGLLEMYGDYDVVDPNIIHDLCKDKSIDDIKSMIKSWQEVDIDSDENVKESIENIKKAEQEVIEEYKSKNNNLDDPLMEIGFDYNDQFGG